MPKYELMYIVGSQVSDDEIPKVNDEVKKFIENEGGLIEKLEDLGKKKLAYPIQKTRTGYYVAVDFSAPSDKIETIEHKIRTSPSFIRHLIVNMDEALVRIEKDRALQARLKLTLPKEEKERPAFTKAPATEKRKKIEIDLDAEIEKALETPEELK